MVLYVLKNKHTFNEVSNDIAAEPNPIKYQDRKATCVRNTCELSQTDGEGVRDLADNQAR